MPKVTVRRSSAEGVYDGIAGDFKVAIDRGENSSPKSIELVMLGLGACTMATVQHYMQRKQMSADDIGVEITSELDAGSNSYGNFKVALDLPDSLSEAERRVIANIAKTCRIHKSLTAPQEIDVVLMEEQEAPV